MNRREVLTRALSAISGQQAEARRQLEQAGNLGMDDLVVYWAAQLEELKVTYHGLLDMLREVNHEQP